MPPLELVPAKGWFIGVSVQNSRFQERAKTRPGWGGWSAKSDNCPLREFSDFLFAFHGVLPGTISLLQ